MPEFHSEKYSANVVGLKLWYVHKLNEVVLYQSLLAMKPHVASSEQCDWASLN